MCIVHVVLLFNLGTGCSSAIMPSDVKARMPIHCDSSISWLNTVEALTKESSFIKKLQPELLCTLLYIGDIPSGLSRDVS